MNPDILAVIMGSLLGFTLLCAVLTMYYSYRMLIEIHHRLDALTNLSRAQPSTFLRGSRVVIPRRASASRFARDAETEPDVDAL